MQTASAAAITWSAPVNIAGDSDVQTGTVVEAYTFGPGGITGTTINGVAFSPFVANGSFPGLSLGGSPGGASVGVFGSLSGAYAALDPAYRSMLRSAAYETDGPLPVTLSLLTPGQAYEIVFWVNDSRGTVGPSRTETLSGDGSSTAMLAFNTTGEGGLGQYVIGTFTADAATESFTILGFDSRQGSVYTASQINGIELLATPEPASMTMIGLGALGLGLARRRKRASR
jgi:hypothetical protein